MVATGTLPLLGASEMSDQTVENLIFAHEVPAFRWFKEFQSKRWLPWIDDEPVTIPRCVSMIWYFKSSSSK